MTLFRPNLRLNRLRIERLSKEVYDERFHAGVNIIRGDNSSGKSTVLNFLYYSIGGDVSDWSSTALLCTRVLAEVSLNGKTATLSREINSKSGQPMDIFGGSMDEAIIAPVGAWARHPYRRSESRESFSQSLFQLLEIPEAVNEASGNVTIHQLLRLMYGDQLSPVGTLFKFEQFDPPLLRDTIGRLVFGTHSNELYANELRIRDLTDQLTGVTSELTALGRVLGQSGQVISASWLAAERSKIEDEQVAVEAQIASAEQALYVAGTEEKLSLDSQRAAYAEVQRIQEDIQQTEAATDTAKFEIADAARFIADLESKLAALNDASATSNAFGRISFQYCPACYSPIDADHPVHACHLCKNPFNSERARTRIVSLINDTAKQLRQSRVLQKDRTSALSRIELGLKGLQDRWKTASERLTRASRTPTSAARQELRALQRTAGYLDRQLEDIASKERMSDTMESLITKKADLTAEVTRLRERNEALRAALSKRLSVAYTEVEREILDLLHKDLPREKAFIEAKTIQIDFSSNKLGVDNETYFSASSRVILRNSFFVGLFSAATKDATFRHLRMCVLDSIEDKGMQQERSHNFQRLVVGVSQAAVSECQIIYATSMIAPELDVPNLTVGHYSTLWKPTLKIMTIAS